MKALKLTCILIFFISCTGHSLDNNRSYQIPVSPKESIPFNTRLKIPDLLENKGKGKNNAVFELTVKKGTTEFFNKVPVITYGYNGSILGPTIRVRRGQTVTINVKNRLNEYTTVHWHGMLLPAEMDGGPHQPIAPGKNWKPVFKVNQPAATLWYHPHGLGTTAIQVYKGLAGMIILDDTNSDKLNLPKKYGIDDIPLIIQDKRFTSDGVPLYLTYMRDIMEGMKGDTVLVNGIINPYLDIKNTKYRFRLLNGSNARIYNFRLSSGKPFYIIATDCGLLEKPVKMKNLVMSPGERAEIIIDFSSYSKGDTLYLKSYDFRIIQFRINKMKNTGTSVPSALADISFLKKSDSIKNRIFQLEGVGHHVSINRKQMNINRIDEYMKINKTETWIVSSSTRGMMGMMGRMHGGGNMFHNFHAHGVHFQIIGRNGRPPLPLEKGWKDTILLEENEEVKILTKFLYKGIFMYHCHILEHEDNGMMGQFRVD